MHQSRSGDSYNMRQRIARLTREIEHFTSQVSRYRTRVTSQEKRCFTIALRALQRRTSDLVKLTIH